MKRLLVMRHAKSDWEAGAADHARPLNARGTRSAAIMGRQLAMIGEVPDHAITSDATRARTTLELAMAAGGWATTMTSTRELYDTTSGGALVVASEAPDVTTLMLVGHQPTWGDLVARLTGAVVQMKTATVVGIDLPIASWSTLPAAHGSLVFVLQARHFDRDPA